MVVLAIVAGAMTFNASAADSVAVNNHCKVFSVKDARKVRLVYTSIVETPTYVRILDAEDDVIFFEKISEGGFVKDFNFDLAPNGEYKFVVSSGSYTHEQVVSLEDAEALVVSNHFDLSKAQFVLTTIEGQPALLGKNASGANLRYAIYNQDGDRLESVEIANNEEIHTKFKFDGVRGEELTFKFFIQDELIREKVVKI